MKTCKQIGVKKKKWSKFSAEAYKKYLMTFKYSTPKTFSI